MTTEFEYQDFWIDRAERLNEIIARATQMGDGAPVMGAAILLSLTDEEWKQFNDNADMEVINAAAINLMALGVDIA